MTKDVAQNEMELVTEQEKMEVEETGEEILYENDLDIDLHDDIELIDFDSLEANQDKEADSSNETGRDKKDETNGKTTEDQEELEEITFDPSNVVPSVAKLVNRIPEAGVLSVVNSEKNGKRVSISSEVMNRLKNPETLQVGFLEGNLVIGRSLGDSYTSYTLKKQGAKQIIYSKELVEQMTDLCELDFSERTSITFPKASYQKMNDEVVALVSML